MNELLCASPRCKPPTRHKPDCVGDPQNPCRGCLPAQAADGLRLCWHCTARLGEHARAAAELWSELGLVLVGGGIGDEIRQRNPGAGLNLKPAIIDHRAAIRHTLVSWTQLITDERGLSLPWRWRTITLPTGVEGPRWRTRTIDQDTKTLGTFVAKHANWLAAQDFADEVSGELAELVSVARSLRQPSQTRIIEIGPCPQTVVIEADDDEEEMRFPCKGVVRALLRTEASLLPSAIQCDADDEHTWASHQWRHLGREMRNAA